jgi:hypothetical protein
MSRVVRTMPRAVRLWLLLVGPWVQFRLTYVRFVLLKIPLLHVLSRVPSLSPSNQISPLFHTEGSSFAEPCDSADHVAIHRILCLCSGLHPWPGTRLVTEYGSRTARKDASMNAELIQRSNTGYISRTGLEAWNYVTNNYGLVAHWLQATLNDASQDSVTRSKQKAELTYRFTKWSRLLHSISRVGAPTCERKQEDMSCEYSGNKLWDLRTTISYFLKSRHTKLYSSILWRVKSRISMNNCARACACVRARACV